MKTLLWYIALRIIGSKPAPYRVPTMKRCENPEHRYPE